MAVSIAATASATTTSSRSPAVTFANYVPKQNDVVAMFAASTAGGATAAAPSGWVLPTPDSGANPCNSTAHTYAFAYHLVTSGEETGVTLTYTATNLWGATQTGNVTAIVLRGVDPANVIDSLTSGFSSVTTATPHIFPALTGTNLSNGSAVVYAVAKDGTGTYTTPSGLSSQIAYNTNQANNLFVRNALTASADIAAVNITPSAGDEYCTFSAAFNKTTGALTTPQFVAPGNFTNTTSTSFAFPVPPLATGDDVVFVFLCTNVAGSIASVATGFTQAGSSPQTESTIRWSAYWKRDNGTDSGTYTFTTTNNSFQGGVAMRYTGCIASGDPVDVATGAHNATSAVYPNTSLTTLTNNDLVVWAGCSLNADTTVYPAGYNPDYYYNLDLGFYIADKAQAAAGATGTLSATSTSGTNQHLVWLGALKPAAAAAAPPGRGAAIQAVRRATLY